MCDLTMALMAASTVVGAYGAHQQGMAEAQAMQAQSQAALMNAQINDRNAMFAEQRARDALMRGQEEEQRVRQDAHQLKGRQTVGLAAAGLDLSFGSPLDVLVDTQIGMELDSMRVRRNAALEAEDFDRQAWSYRAQGGLDRMESQSALKGASAAGKGAMVGAVGSLLSGGARIGQYKASIG